jgi:hypothetical protein
MALQPVIQVVDHQTFGIEPQNRHTRQGYRLARLDETCPPLDCSAIARGNGLSKPAFDRLFNGELTLHIGQRPADLGLAKRA